MKKSVLIIGTLSLAIALATVGCASAGAPPADTPAAPEAAPVQIDSMVNIAAPAEGGATVTVNDTQGRAEVRGDAWSIAIWNLPEGERDLSGYREIVIDWEHNGSGRVELQPVLLDAEGEHLEPESDGWRGLNANERGQSNIILGSGAGGLNISAEELSDVHQIGFKLHSNANGATYYIYSIDFK